MTDIIERMDSLIKKISNVIEQIDKNEEIHKVKKIIIEYFYKHDIYKSYSLEQSYLLYKSILNLNENCKLIKGYIINHFDKIYYSHFWVEYNNRIYDISTETYLLDYKLKYHKDIKKTRILMKSLPNDIVLKYKNFDIIDFNDSYMMYIENKFLEDVEKKQPIEIFNKMKEIYNEII